MLKCTQQYSAVQFGPPWLLVASLGWHLHTKSVVITGTSCLIKEINFTSHRLYVYVYPPPQRFTCDSGNTGRLLLLLQQADAQSWSSARSCKVVKTVWTQSDWVRIVNGWRWKGRSPAVSVWIRDGLLIVPFWCVNHWRVDQCFRNPCYCHVGKVHSFLPPIDKAAYCFCSFFF